MIEPWVTIKIIVLLWLVFSEWIWDTNVGAWLNLSHVLPFFNIMSPLYTLLLRVPLESHIKFYTAHQPLQCHCSLYSLPLFKTKFWSLMSAILLFLVQIRIAHSNAWNSVLQSQSIQFIQPPMQHRHYSMFDKFQ